MNSLTTISKSTKILVVLFEQEWGWLSVAGFCILAVGLAFVIHTILVQNSLESFSHF